MPANRGLFITLEGGEGSGKSTLIQGLAARIQAEDIGYVKTREPGGTPLAEEIRKLALHPPGDDQFSPMAEALLMNAARADHLEKLIVPALASGLWVLCDRFADSTRVYQGLAGGISKSLLRMVENEVVGEFKPDLTLLLDIPVDLAAERRSQREPSGDVFELRGAAFHESVRQAFLEIAKEEPDRISIIDASQALPDVFEQAWIAIEAKRADRG